MNAELEFQRIRDAISQGDTDEAFDIADRAWRSLADARTDILAVLRDALEMAKLAETLTGCRGDDDFVAAFKEKVEAAIAKASRS